MRAHGLEASERESRGSGGKREAVGRQAEGSWEAVEGVGRQAGGSLEAVVDHRKHHSVH